MAEIKSCCKNQRQGGPFPDPFGQNQDTKKADHLSSLFWVIGVVGF
jgi:hypothetical protein